MFKGKDNYQENQGENTHISFDTIKTLKTEHTFPNQDDWCVTVVHEPSGHECMKIIPKADYERFEFSKQGIRELAEYITKLHHPTLAITGDEIQNSE